MLTLEPEVNDERIRYWNKVYRTALLVLVALGVAIIGFTAYKINDNTKQVKQLIIFNQKGTVEAREANKARQDNLQGYIKCVLLLRYDYPQLNTTSTRAEVSQALDSCAVKN